MSEGKAAAVEPLATPADVQLLLQLLPPSQRPDISDDNLKSLIKVASSRLRNRVPSVDARIALWQTTPGVQGALDPDLVANVVATMVKRAVTNPSGASSVTDQETVGPYSRSTTSSFSNGQGSTPVGEIVVTDADLIALGIATRRGRMRSIPVRPSMPGVR